MQTIAEKWMERGMEKGMEKGVQQVVTDMINYGMPLKDVVKITGLPAGKIKQMISSMDLKKPSRPS